MAISENTKLILSLNTGRIKLIRTDGQVRYYNLSEIKVEEAPDNWDNNLLILPNGWKCIIDNDYTLESFASEIQEPWKMIVIQDNPEVCYDRRGYCEYKTDQGDGFKCNGCNNMHPRFAVVKDDIPEKEVALGLEILKADSEFTNIAKKNSIELAELYKMCSSIVTTETKAGTVGEIRYGGVYLTCAEFMIIYEKNQGKYILFDLYIDSKHYKMRKQDISLRDGNVLWGNDLELYVYGYDFNTMSFVCLNCIKFPIEEKLYTKSQLIKLFSQNSIGELSLTRNGFQWTPGVKFIKNNH